MTTAAKEPITERQNRAIPLGRPSQPRLSLEQIHKSLIDLIATRFASACARQTTTWKKGNLSYRDMVEPLPRFEEHVQTKTKGSKS